MMSEDNKTFFEHRIDMDSAVIEVDSLLEANIFDDVDRWKTHNQIHAVQKFKSNNLTDEEYDKVAGILKEIKETDDFKTYSKAFARLCYFCHVVPRGVIIKKYVLRRGLKRHSFYMEYSYNTKKITLPEGTILYHMSKVNGIKELRPVYRGKSERGFLYDKPRVYFTIRRNMPKFLADYKPNQKLYMYVCQKPIKQVFVDPLVWSNLQGAVYVETNNPIPVKQVDSNQITSLVRRAMGNKERLPDDGQESKNEAVDMIDVYNFIQENGLLIESLEDIDFEEEE